MGNPSEPGSSPRIQAATPLAISELALGPISWGSEV
jgi:hypothetical protein